ncbi:restriction endonuclease subunit S, partial [Aeromonas veronii]|uniref:restriction endonuclease subunit S n=2 Tax=Pseudomonadota TaxID=1224 RepID=UPI003F6736F1
RESKSNKSTFKCGDVLYGKLRPYLNKVIIADLDGVCTTEIVPIVPDNGLHPAYLKYLLKSPAFQRYVNSLMYGVKMPRLGTEDAIKSVHPLPPLAEQHRIVAKVDELMALCDQLEQRCESQLAAHQTLVETLLATLTDSC